MKHSLLDLLSLLLDRPCARIVDERNEREIAGERNPPGGLETAEGLELYECHAVLNSMMYGEDFTVEDVSRVSVNK